MKPLLILLALALVPLAGATHAQSVNSGSFFPTLTFPEPTPEPVTRSDSGADR